MTLSIPFNNSVFVPICAKNHMNWRKIWTSVPFNSATSVPGSASWPRSQLPPHSSWVMDAGMEQKPAKTLHFWNILKRIQDFNGLLELLRTQMSPAQLSMPHFLVCAASGCILCRSFALQHLQMRGPNDTNTSHWQPKLGAANSVNLFHVYQKVLGQDKCPHRGNHSYECMYKSDLYLRVSDLTWTLGSCWHPSFKATCPYSLKRF